MWIGPFSCHQVAVPAQERVGGNQSVCAQLSRQKSDEGGEDRAVRPGQAWPRNAAAQHGYLMAEHEWLDVLGCGGTAE